jgi:hypothetical protein
LISGETLAPLMQLPVVLDANRFLHKTLGGASGLRYIAVGMPQYKG